jgi:hypothetical protein
VACQPCGDFLSPRRRCDAVNNDGVGFCVVSAKLTLMLLLRRSCVAHESTVIAYETRLADPNRTGAMRGKMCELCTGKSARRRESGNWAGPWPFLASAAICGLLWGGRQPRDHADGDAIAIGDVGRRGRLRTASAATRRCSEVSHKPSIAASQSDSKRLFNSSTSRWSSSPAWVAIRTA